MIEVKLTFIDLVQQGRTLTGQFLNNFLLGEMSAFYFIPLCRAQKFSGQDVRTRQSLRLANFLRQRWVYEKQGLTQKGSLIQVTRHSALVTAQLMGHLFWLSLPHHSRIIMAVTYWARNCRRFISVFLCARHCAHLSHLILQQRYQVGIILFFHLTEVEIEAQAQNVAARKCLSQSWLLPCISILLPLLLV